jgi:flagellar biosynthesis chaperone FliJ
MPRSANSDSGLLLTLERYRNLVLEEAQHVHAQCAEALEKDNAAHTQIEAILEAAYSAHRATLTGAVSPEALRLAYHYARVQATSLAQARSACDRTRTRVIQAQDQLAARLEEFKVIERLRENRQRSRAQLQRRRAQTRLDELGIIKACQVEGSWPSAE